MSSMRQRRKVFNSTHRVISIRMPAPLAELFKTLPRSFVMRLLNKRIKEMT